MMRISNVFCKLICTCICMVVLTGCGQVQTAGGQSEAVVQGSEEAGNQGTAMVPGSEDTGNQGTAVVPEMPESAPPLADPSATLQPSDSQVSIQENRVVVSDVIYDDVLNPIGTILSRQITIYNEADAEDIVYEFDVVWPEIDVSFDGADLINETMLEYVDNMEELMTQGQTWEKGPGGVNLWFTSTFEGFTYRDDHYISFVQNEYDFAGGAHGMPYREPFTFHLQSGERLALTDIIGNSEEELKEIVTGYFVEMINAAPEDYWENAGDFVGESITLESNFVLTPEGIQFYLLPYDIAPYVAGFPAVTVPYEEFEMKIVF